MIFTRSLRKPWWWLKSFYSKQQKMILGAALLGVIIFLAIRNILPLLPQLKPKARIGVVGQYTLENLPPDIAATLGRGLFKMTKSGEVEPDLAQSWQMDDKQTNYQVKLLPNQVWNDGTVIVSSDIAFNLPDVTVSYPDDQTLDFQLTQPYSPFLTLLTRPVFKNGRIGAGDYTIKAIDWQGQYLKRLRLAGQNQELDYRFYFSHQAAWLGFRLGEVDRLINFIINPVDQNWQNKVKVESRINTQTDLVVLFNLNDSNLSSKNLRQALAYSIKSKSPDPWSRALSPISPDSWAYNPNVKPYDYNAAQAKDLFSKFEQEASNSGRMQLALGTSASFLHQAEDIAKDWQDTLGIKVDVKTINSLESDWQAVLVAQEIPLDPDQHALWHSTQSTNITHYSDLKVDKLLEDGRQISDQSKRKEIYQDFQRFLVEDSPAIFLYHPTVYTISRK